MERTLWNFQIGGFEACPGFLTLPWDWFRFHDPTSTCQGFTLPLLFPLFAVATPRDFMLAVTSNATSLSTRWIFLVSFASCPGGQGFIVDKFLTWSVQEK